MSILNVLLSSDQLVVTVDTWAEDALSGQRSHGAKLLLIPQHQLLLATRGSAQLFLRIYQLALEASFRADFTMEQLTVEIGRVIDQLWPNYVKAVEAAGLPIKMCTTELVLGGWSPKHGRMMATAYAKHDVTIPAVVQPITGQLASPGDPLKQWPPSMATQELLVAGRLQAQYLNASMGRTVAGGRLLLGFLKPGQAVLKDLGAL
ncbi:hypothetical protein [Stenotrophomonas sp. NPDC077659]|uniref:hypothetical protein n=1 Tax=Stenotrophomonas sp. NPDC077659 TaxID=3390694 RepID=UPI003D02F03A